MADKIVSATLIIVLAVGIVGIVSVNQNTGAAVAGDCWVNCMDNLMQACERYIEPEKQSDCRGELVMVCHNHCIELKEEADCELNCKKAFNIAMKGCKLMPSLEQAKCTAKIVKEQNSCMARC